MSGEFASTLQMFADLGMMGYTALHSSISQYGSMSRGMSFMSGDLRERLQNGLHVIQRGTFARELIVEQEAGSPTLNALREAARAMPPSKLERELCLALVSGVVGYRSRPV